MFLPVIQIAARHDGGGVTAVRNLDRRQHMYPCDQGSFMGDIIVFAFSAKGSVIL